MVLSEVYDAIIIQPFPHGYIQGLTTAQLTSSSGTEIKLVDIDDTLLFRPGSHRFVRR